MSKTELKEAAAEIYAADDNVFLDTRRQIQAIRLRAVDLYDWPEQVRTDVLAGAIRPGMPADAVYLARGAPSGTSEDESSTDARYTWMYRTIDQDSGKTLYVHFDADWVVTKSHRDGES